MGPRGRIVSGRDQHRAHCGRGRIQDHWLVETPPHLPTRSSYEESGDERLNETDDCKSYKKKIMAILSILEHFFNCRIVATMNAEVKTPPGAKVES